jgi:hypothetical protein
VSIIDKLNKEHFVQMVEDGKLIALITKHFSKLKTNSNFLKALDGLLITLLKGGSEELVSEILELFK